MPETMQERVERLFTHHPPTGDQQPKFKALEDKFKELAHLILEVTPEGREQTVAITQLHMARMCANAAIACN